MSSNHKITCAVLTALSAHAVASHAADADQTTPATPNPTAATGPESGAIQEVTVTAQRRAESVQDVPITVQAITGATLAQLNLRSAEDLLKYTPNVTYSGNGPGTGNIFMRGMGGVGSGNQSQSTTAAFPNVALYLDEQSMQFPGRNNDVYLIDMARVEVLEGPQGTLFGGGAQAGAIRYITNKPNLNQITGDANGGYGATTHGDNNSLANFTLNVPLIADTLAVRAVVFTETRGGYIDNVPSTIRYIPGSLAAVSGGDPHANNGNLVQAHTNPITYGGARLSLLWKLNDDWNFLLQQNYQDMHADGYFYTYPFDSNGTALGKYQIAAFTPAFNKDRYESTAWTVNGNIGGFQAIYTGSYMVRHIEGQQDYSNYMRSVHGSYYGCIGTGAYYFNEKKFPALVGSKLQCYPPTGSWNDKVSNTHWSHELRVSSPADYRLRGIAGVYWEKFVINDDMNFNYLPIPQCDPANLAAAQAPGGPFCLSAVGPLPGAFATDPALREGTNTAFGEDAQRGYKQTAFFLSLDFDLIPHVLTLSGGGRFYHYEEFEHGSEYYTESTSPLLINHPNGACTAAGACGFPINLDKSETGSRWRGNLTWHITPDVMAYYTYSQGFRPGGFNRTKSLPGQPPSLKQEAPYASPADSTYQYLKPAGYDSDNLTNNEVGFKSEFFDHRLLFNVSGYIMNWSSVQLSLFDPVHLGNTTFNVNGPTYKIKGFEVQFVARVTEGLTIEGSSAVNSSEQTDAPCLKSAGVVAGNSHFTNNPTPLGACISQINGLTYTNPFGQLDTRPAFSPPWMFNIRARYDWEVGSGYRPYAWVGASHIGSMSNEPASFPDGNTELPSGCLTPGTNAPSTTLCKYEIPGYTTYDAAIGVAKDQWSAELHAANLSNEYGPTNISSGQFIRSEIPLRPKTIMFNVGYKF